MEQTPGTSSLRVFHLDYVVARGDFGAGPMTPMVQCIGFGNHSVAEHELVGATVRLEDAGSQEDVSHRKDSHQQKPEIVQK